MQFYGESKKAELPVEQAVFDYLYGLTDGRLRYIFGLVSRLLNRLYIGDLTDKVTLDIAKPMLVKLGKDRMQRAGVTEIEERVLRLLIKRPNVTASQMARKLKKTPQYLGRVLPALVEKGLASSQKKGRDRVYIPSIDAVIAYTEIS